MTGLWLAGRGGIDDLVSTLQQQDFKLNKAGGVVKVRSTGWSRLHACQALGRPAEPQHASL